MDDINSTGTLQGQPTARRRQTMRPRPPKAKQYKRHSGKYHKKLPLIHHRDIHHQMNIFHRCGHIIYSYVLSTIILSASCHWIQASQESEPKRALPPWLPRTYSDFERKYSCSDEQDLVSRIQGDDFVQWVVYARHTTWSSGWDVPITDDINMKSKQNVASLESNKNYARVFDLLNFSRLQNLKPQQIDVDKICHKGMESMFGYTKYIIDAPPEKPNKYIPHEAWCDLWKTCHKQLNGHRISSSCINIPAVVVVNPNPPRKVNNPCHYEYRMVDGAHRICLRKYLLILLEGEILDYKTHMSKMNPDSNSTKANDTQYQIKMLHMDLNRMRYGQYFILNQTVFESMLTNVDPNLWSIEITKEVKRNWVQWMNRVMVHIQ
jgi:hypothetical protein